MLMKFFTSRVQATALVAYSIATPACSTSATSYEIDAAATSIDAPDAALLATGPIDQPAKPCIDTLQDVYAATPVASARNGDVIACSVDASLSRVMLTTQTGLVITNPIEICNDVKQYVIAYQTRDGQGRATVSTARVLLPSVAVAHVPLLVAAHGSAGLADSCAPTKAANSDMAPLGFPLAARGVAVIFPDLAGLGNDGTQAYLDNHAQGWQLLDAARALRRFMQPGFAAQQFAMSGFSQGGGAVLAARALARADQSSGPDLGQLAGTVAFAPQYPVRDNSFGYLDLLRHPDAITVAAGISFPTIAVLRQYAFFENSLGTGQGARAFPTRLRAGVSSAVGSQCLIPFGGYVQGQMFQQGDLIDNPLRIGLLSCFDSVGASCSGEAKTYWQYLQNNLLQSSADSGPILLVQGALDNVLPPAKEAACVAKSLTDAGATVDVCAKPLSTHATLMRSADVAVPWLEAVISGQTRPQCDNTALPACEQ
jgi:predicted esterase